MPAFATSVYFLKTSVDHHAVGPLFAPAGRQAFGGSICNSQLRMLKHDWLTWQASALEQGETREKRGGGGGGHEICINIANSSLAKICVNLQTYNTFPGMNDLVWPCG